MEHLAVDARRARERLVACVDHSSIRRVSSISDHYKSSLSKNGVCCDAVHYGVFTCIQDM